MTKAMSAGVRDSTNTTYSHMSKNSNASLAMDHPTNHSSSDWWRLPWTVWTTTTIVVAVLFYAGYSEWWNRHYEEDPLCHYHHHHDYDNDDNHHHYNDNAACATNALSSLPQTLQQLQEPIVTLATLSAAVTLQGPSFPTVTVPHFCWQAQLLLQSQSSQSSLVQDVQWWPLVTDDTRARWEAYSHTYNNTLLHPDTIWSNGDRLAPGTLPSGMGHYLPTWQHCLLQNGDDENERINMDWNQAAAIDRDTVAILQQERAALWQPATIVTRMMDDHERRVPLPLPSSPPSQHTPPSDHHDTDVVSLLTYPVFAAPYHEGPVVGVVAATLSWKALFSNLRLRLPVLPRRQQQQSWMGVVEQHDNATDPVSFAYRMRDDDVSFVVGTSILPGATLILDEWWDHAGQQRTTVPISSRRTYRIRLYALPKVRSIADPDGINGNDDDGSAVWMWTLVVTAAVGLASLLQLLVFQIGHRRQRDRYKRELQLAHRAAAAERELNEFLAHEVRNPLAAAIAACNFVHAALHQQPPHHDSDNDDDDETQQNARQDIQVVQSSLHFINDFLRSMLDLHRATLNQLQIQTSMVDLKTDVIDPVLAIVYQRVASFKVVSECPDNLMIMTDPMRLKQVILNLVRNSTKFVQQGFIRVRVQITSSVGVLIHIEDSGPGMPLEKQRNLFQKYQESLDLLNQGTGLGLSLCKKLMENMGGQIRLDTGFHSGIPGCPGTRFVLQLNVHPQDIDASAHAGWVKAASLRNISRASLSLRSLPEVEIEFGNSGDNDDDDDSDDAGCAGLFSRAVLSRDPEIAIVPHPSSKHAKLDQDDDDDVNQAKQQAAIRVLFVDDDSMLRKLFVRAVRKARPEWQIKEASSGEMAIQLCETDTFDLIFLDQYMASTEKQLLGTETAQAMRAQGVLAVICGLSANDVRSGFLQAGANNFMMKPFPCRGEALDMALRELLQ